MAIKRLIILTGVILYCFATSFAQNGHTFKWADTTFTIGSKRAIKIIIWDGHDFGKEARIACDTIIHFMKNNPNLKIGIYWHTEQLGDSIMDIKRSQLSAQTCVMMIEEGGIDSSRLIPKGWGYMYPIIPLSEIKKLNRKEIVLII